MMVTRMKPEQTIEGPEAFRRFDSTVLKLLSVSRETLQKREAEYQKQASKNPNKRGPKRKTKPSASLGPAAV